MNSFTGLDLEKARQDIINYDQTSLRVYDKVGSCITGLFETLVERWASPKAEEYTKAEIPEIQGLLDNFLTTRNKIRDGAIHAVENLARANGLDYSFNYDDVVGGFIIKSDGSYQSNLAPYEACKNNINGAVGMDVQGVRLALDIFNAEAKEAIKLFDEVPEAIALYDPEGQLVYTYQSNIVTFKDIFTEYFNSVTSKMNVYLETETNNILLAKQNAQDTMAA